MSEEVEGGDSDVNECSSESNEHALQGFDVDSETERETRQVRRQRRAHRPPTSEEIQEHLRTHLPYRSQHRRRDPGEYQVDVATVALDYCFLRNMPGEESIPVLVMRDRETRMLSAHAVPMKGAVVEWTAQQVVRDLERLGHHGRLVVRSDQEAALRSLVSEVARLRGDAVTIPEHSAVGDSQGNGFIERAVRTVEEMVRTLKLDLETRISQKMNITHKVIPWLVEHAVDLVNKLQVGFERLKCKRFNGDLVRFANPVMMRVAGKVQGGVMAERWFEGLYMGMRFHTNEAVVMRLLDGVMVRTRSIQSQERQVSKDMLDKLVGVPWDPTRVVRARVSGGTDEGEHVIPAREVGEDGMPVTRELIPRSMYITGDMVKQYGPTPGCPKCRAVARAHSSQHSMSHTQTCRVRIEEMVKHDPSTRDRLSRAEERKTRYFAEHLEKTFGPREIAGGVATSGSSSGVAPTPAMETDDSTEVKNTSISSSSVPTAKRARSDVAGEIPIPVAEPVQVHVTAGEKRAVEEDSLDTEMEDAGNERAARSARLALVERVVLQLTSEMDLDEETHDDPSVNPELIMQEEDWVNHGKDEELFDPKMVALAKQEELQKFEKLKVYEVVKEEEFRNDPGRSKSAPSGLSRTKGPKPNR